MLPLINQYSNISSDKIEKNLNKSHKFYNNN